MCLGNLGPKDGKLGTYVSWDQKLGLVDSHALEERTKKALAEGPRILGALRLPVSGPRVDQPGYRRQVKMTVGSSWYDRPRQESRFKFHLCHELIV